MRVVFLGASPLAQKTALVLSEAGHDVVIIDRDAERIKEATEHLDCAFLLGDGTRPDVLKEANPGQSDILYCITNHDQTNIITSLVGKSLGIKRVVTKIEDEDYLPICEELGLTDTIVPDRTVSKYLVGLTKAPEED
jgi:trk system potassium uptake protein TrkA